MNLSELDKHQEAIIKQISCNDDLKQRFYSFGIIKGATVEVEKVSFAKNTMEILVEDTSIGIRIDEAKKIEIEVI